MTVTVKDKTDLVVPARLRRQAGIKPGDRVEMKVSGGNIVITPKLVIDRSKVPTADDEYTAEQRAVIDAQLAEGLEDLRKGRTAGPFNTADEMIAHMKGELKQRAAAKKPKRAR